MSSWYFNKNLKPQGPLSFEELKKKIMRGEIAPGDLICKEGEETWSMAMEWRDFPKELFPAFQQNPFKSSSPDEKEWILLNLKEDHTPGSQEGPYSLEEVQKMLSSGNLSPEAYVWRSGLSGWVRIMDRGEFIAPPFFRDL